MKKLLIATIEFPPQKGGVANYLAGLAGALPQDRVTVLAPRSGSVQNFDSSQKYKIYRKNLLSKLIWPKWLPMIWHLWSATRKEKAEAILVGQILPVGTAAMIVKRFFKIPYFVSCHGMDILTAAENPRKKELMNKILEQASGVVANSQFTKNELIKLGVSESNITIVYPCPDKIFARTTISPFATTASNSEAVFLVDEIRKKYHLQDKKILLTVGRLVARKGQDKVIEALPAILKHVPQVIYVIVGNGPEISNIKYQISKLRLENEVLLTGEISDETLKAFYQLCNVFVMTPRQIGPDVEGFGTVFLEANQFGKPVVAGKSGGVTEAVLDGVTGFVVDPMGTLQIAEAVIKLLTDKDLANKLGQQGKERVEKEFRWEIQVKKFISKLESQHL